jgi:tetratricopeptide (TPR) repeat protein
MLEANSSWALRRVCAMNKKTPSRADGWLEQAYPQVHHLLLALDGDELARDWLKENSQGVSLLVRALQGKPKALAALHAGEPAEMDDLFDLIDNDDLTRFLDERRPDLARLFQAIRIGRTPTHPNGGRPEHRRLAGVVHDLYQLWCNSRSGERPIDNGSASDVGCLIGEMHLKAGEYEKAIEAFTRAIATKAEADLYEGRASAFRALADADERNALKLRHGK